MLLSGVWSLSVVVSQSLAEVVRTTDHGKCMNKRLPLLLPMPDVLPFQAKSLYHMFLSVLMIQHGMVQ